MHSSCFTFTGIRRAQAPPARVLPRGLQLTRPQAPGMSAQNSPRTVEDIYEDFELRRNGLLTALTTGGRGARFSGVERSAQPTQQS